MFKSIGICGAFGAFGVPLLAVVGAGLGIAVLGAGAGYLIAGAKGAGAVGGLLAIL